ncbi:MAG: hypothetical protein NTY75_02530 [Candidatus Shapirobacteria bacterium]|nr:hypothetical protein [Candidatus Shapirobacteria bacterium]
MLQRIESFLGFKDSLPVEGDIGKIVREQGLARGKVLIVGIDPEEVMIQQFPGCKITVIDPGRKGLKTPGVVFKKGYFPNNYEDGKVDMVVIKHLVHFGGEDEAWNILQVAGEFSDVVCFSVPGKRGKDINRSEKFAQLLTEQGRRVESFELPKDHGGGKLYIVRK